VTGYVILLPALLLVILFLFAWVTWKAAQ